MTANRIEIFPSITGESVSGTVGHLFLGSPGALNFKLNYLSEAITFRLGFIFHVYIIFHWENNIIAAAKTMFLNGKDQKKYNMTSVLL